MTNIIKFDEEKTKKQISTIFDECYNVKDSTIDCDLFAQKLSDALIINILKDIDFKKMPAWDVLRQFYINSELKTHVDLMDFVINHLDTCDEKEQNKAVEEPSEIIKKLNKEKYN